MSVDKFGRYSDQLTNTGAKGPPGEGFKLTPTGDYDIGEKLLRNVKQAVNDTDAVNLAQLKDKLGHHMGAKTHNNETVWNAGNLRISHVKAPQRMSDAANAQWVLDNTLKKTTDTWDCNQKRLVNVKNPTDDLDAVNKTTLTKEVAAVASLVLNKLPRLNQQTLDCGRNRLVNVENPTDDLDAVNKQTLDKGLKDIFPRLRPTGDVYDFGSKRVGGVGIAKYADEVVTKAYLEKNVIYNKNGRWECSTQSLGNVGDPYNTMDAVNVNYLVRLLGEVLYDFNKIIENLTRGVVTIDTPEAKKDWIKVNVAERYFLPPNNKFRTYI